MNERLAKSLEALRKDASDWMGRQIAHPDHAALLERLAATHEFGGKLPRAAAEDQAYQDYLKDPKVGQHVLAAAHHLAGIKAAHAAGDMEAARKHGVMYNLHSKVLGNDPVGPAHPAVAAILQQAPPRVYKFKAHPGDLFAVSPSQEAPVQKALATLHDGLEGLLKARRPSTEDLLWQHAGGLALDAPEDQEAMKAHLVQHHGLDEATAHRVVHAYEGLAMDDPADRRTFAGVVDAMKKRPGFRKSELADWATRELKTRKKKTGKPRPCVCPAYSHPHRAGGGKCGAK